MALSRVLIYRISILPYVPAYGPDRFDSPAVAPVRTVDGNTHCLELWHGPTCAFKDMALQMLPHLLTAGDVIDDLGQHTAPVDGVGGREEISLRRQLPADRLTWSCGTAPPAPLKTWLCRCCPIC